MAIRQKKKINTLITEQIIDRIPIEYAHRYDTSPLYFYDFKITSEQLKKYDGFALKYNINSVYNKWIGAYIIDQGIKGIGSPGSESFGLSQRLTLSPIPNSSDNGIYTVGNDSGYVYIKDICFTYGHNKSNLGHTLMLDYTDQSMSTIENYNIRFILDPVSRWENKMDNQTFEELIISDPIYFQAPIYHGFYGFYIEKQPLE